MPTEDIEPEEEQAFWYQIAPDGSGIAFCICVRYIEGSKHDYAAAMFNPHPIAEIQIDDCAIMTVERQGKMSRRKTIQTAARALAQQLNVIIDKKPNHTDGVWYFYLIR